jgi:hypothetical protein
MEPTPQAQASQRCSLNLRLSPPWGCCWRRDGTGVPGRVCCSRLALWRQKPERDEGVQLVKAIYTMYNWLISPLGWQRPRQVQAPWQGGGHQWGRAGSSNTFLALEGVGRGSADGASRYKNVERIL